MLTFCVYRDRIQGENCAGCDNVKALFLAGLIEITFLVVGILALLETGALSKLSQANAWIVLSSGSFLLLTDIANTYIHKNKAQTELAETVTKESELKKRGISLENSQISVKSLFPQSHKAHIHQVVSFEEVGAKEKELVSGGFFFFFSRRGKERLSDIHVCLKTSTGLEKCVNWWVNQALLKIIDS